MRMRMRNGDEEWGWEWGERMIKCEQVRKRAEERKRESEPVLASVRRLGWSLRLPEHRNLDG